VNKQEENVMYQDIINHSSIRMNKSIESFKSELSKLRTNRAHPSLLEHIKIDYYGTPTPLNQTASVNVEGARSLAITPYDKSMIQAIEKAIMTSDLGLNPTTVGQVIRVTLPTLTEERRKELIKVLKDEAEKARISIRNIRRDANTEFKRLLKEKMISEDEAHQAEHKVQNLTDQFIKSVDEILVDKEKHLSTI
jgi:ribosome recycling factor